MNISGISQGQPAALQKPPEGSNRADSEIRALEQKLQRLDSEKQKAVQSKDTERERELEKQIRELKKQIDRLRNRDNNRQEETGGADSCVQPRVSVEPEKGKYIDEVI